MFHSPSFPLETKVCMNLFATGRAFHQHPANVSRYTQTLAAFGTFFSIKSSISQDINHLIGSVKYENQKQLWAGPCLHTSYYRLYDVNFIEKKCNNPVKKQCSKTTNVTFSDNTTCVSYSLFDFSFLRPDNESISTFSSLNLLYRFI